MTIKFGPSGMGPVNQIEETFEIYKNAGIKAVEIPFTYGIFIRKLEDINKIKYVAEKYNIILSIHAPYWINLNSDEKKKVENSKKRILDCCEIGEKLGAKLIVFHAGYYGKYKKEVAYENIKKEILNMQEVIKKNKWSVKLAPETMGKINVFGSVKEILDLVKDTGCSFTLDFAHLYARSLGKMNYDEMIIPFKKFKNIHCHFSGIEFGNKGERKHKPTSKKEWEKLLTALSKSNINFTIINEANEPVEDSILGIKIYEKIKK